MLRVAAPVTFAVLAAVAGGCGDDPSPTPTRPDRPATTTSPGPDPLPRLEAPPCPAELANCRRASGRIIYVERVDPDGDGDAHFVLVSRESVTAPGITIVDVRRDLRPHPLPGVGDELAAAGPVLPGSAGQRQIQALAVNLGRR